MDTTTVQNLESGAAKQGRCLYQYPGFWNGMFSGHVSTCFWRSRKNKMRKPAEYDLHSHGDVFPNILSQRQLDGKYPKVKTSGKAQVSLLNVICFEAFIIIMSNLPVLLTKLFS